MNDDVIDEVMDAFGDVPGHMIAGWAAAPGRTDLDAAFVLVKDAAMAGRVLKFCEGRQFGMSPRMAGYTAFILARDELATCPWLDEETRLQLTNEHDDETPFVLLSADVCAVWWEPLPGSPSPPPAPS